MDIYDPQTLGFMVFGGFMVISAIGIFLVSTFSMKETSYEEALAKQKKEQEKAQQAKSEKKKKEKSVEKKGKPKKKDEKPNGRIPEAEPVQDVSETEVEVEPVIVPTIETPIMAVSSPLPPESSPPASKEKRKKEKKVAKVEPAPNPVSAHAPVGSSSKQAPAPVVEMVTREVPVMAVPPVGAQQGVPIAATPSTVSVKKIEATTNQDEAKQDAPAKKRIASKKKSEPINVPADSLDGPLYIPYKTLLSTVSSMDFSEGEAQQLIEILMDKAGIVQDTWHTATQKGDPVTALKRQLDEKEKQLVAEQEDSSAAKSKLREVNKELAAEKTKASANETKLKEQLTMREEELNAMQTRMQASYQDHVAETQQLQAKIRGLQEQLENGPTAQIARLQQENSILRDALNQATSQTESKQNAELAKLRQECAKLTKELSEKSEALQQDEQQRKVLEGKVSKYEQQLTELQSNQQETERTLQKRLDDVSEELRKSQSNYSSLLTDAEKMRGEKRTTLSTLTDLQAKMLSTEADLKSKVEELEKLHSQLMEAGSEKERLEERIKSIETLLEAGQNKETEKGLPAQTTQQEELEQLGNRLKDKDIQITTLEQEVLQLKETIEQQKNKNNEEAENQLRLVHTQTKEMLQGLFPEVSVSSQQLYSDWLQEFKQKTLEFLNQPNKDPSDLALKLKEAEEAQSTLQADCDQYRTVLAETEGMLKDLQKSVEEEEHVWKGKLAESEAQAQKAQLQVKMLEDMLEKMKLESQNSEQMKDRVAELEVQLQHQLESADAVCQKYSVEVRELSELLNDAQSQLEIANKEVQKHSEELSQVRQRLCTMETHMRDGELAESLSDQVEPDKLKTQLEETVISEQIQRQQLAEEFEKAQRSALNLQEELEKLRAAGDSVTLAGEDIVHLKERLNKEKKMTRDLSEAAAKLQQMLKATQEQLNKEKETVVKLQAQRQEKEEERAVMEEGMKEGTSV
ncbi:ribosome-binding protein 1-like isoform X2 [Chiloscyllium plagiosum]|uniref:ribosome-binding protein 1-like isoform X2 n=1 Tax=Chiloscyllium plagiosum TaxID=36176 RepID=UPI001CB82B4C|nr:ribosome-binding protein 1-like isoform X2 [Chiloscyllium plagiosum]